MSELRIDENEATVKPVRNNISHYLTSLKTYFKQWICQFGGGLVSLEKNPVGIDEKLLEMIRCHSNLLANWKLSK